MPIVPINKNRQAAKAPPRDPPDEPWALMAAAQMHAEGRLIDNESNASERPRSLPKD